jgi:UDP-N-acetylmuramoyl-tripeptide--D-alanyl-D-alanine ligase
MMKRSVADIADMCGGRLLKGDAATQVTGVSTDTRADMTGRLFVPLVGERFDAHEFHEAAAKQGAVAALWQGDRPAPETTLALIEVEDTLAGLQRLAAAYRRELGLKVVGVTGSNGKTSTKDMLAAVLSQRFRVQKTQGNLNNHIGVPLMLLALEEETDVAVLEMGMNHRYEIELLASLARPDLGVITNIGEAHIEFLGSREGIADAKCELIEALSPEGTAVLFGDEPLLRARAGKTQAKVVYYGLEEGNDIQAVNIENKGMSGSEFSLKGDDGRYTLRVPGQHQVGNALAAVAVGLELGMNREEIRTGLAQAQLTARRLEVKPARLGGTVIDDAYNASPASMRPALQMLSEMPGGYKVAVLAGMLELGSDSVNMHREIGRYIAGLVIDHLVCIGELARDYAEGAREGGYPAGNIFETIENEVAVAHLEDVLKRHADDPEGGAILLVKASNGMKLVEVVRALI